MSDTRVCKTCQAEKPMTDFYAHSKSRGGYRLHCKPCVLEHQRGYEMQPEQKARKAAAERARRAANGPRIYTPEAKLRLRLWTHYRMTPEQYDAMLAAQGYACAICESPDPGGKGTWHIDHDHRCCPKVRSCGKCVRAALCATCNVGLGMFRDDAGLLQSAIDYLRYSA